MRTFILSLTVLAFAQPTFAQTLPAPKRQTRLSAAVDRTLKDGKYAFLPPHVSHLLGLSPDEHQVPVKQLVLMGDTIRVRVKVQSKRETKKSDRGIVVEYVTMLNQRNEVVQEGEHGLMIWRRPTQ